jgi:hypothetical protein
MILKTAQKQFHQFSQGLKISSSRAEYFNSTDRSNEDCTETYAGIVN